MSDVNMVTQLFETLSILEQMESVNEGSMIKHLPVFYPLFNGSRKHLNSIRFVAAKMSQSNYVQWVH